MRQVSVPSGPDTVGPVRSGLTIGTLPKTFSKPEAFLRPSLELAQNTTACLASAHSAQIQHSSYSAQQ